MTIETVINYLLVAINAWLGIAFIIGVRRFTFAPLALGGIGFILISVSFIMRLLFLPQPSFWLGLGMLCVVAFSFFYGPSIRSHGITIRKLFLFTR